MNQARAPGSNPEAEPQAQARGRKTDNAVPCGAPLPNERIHRILAGPPPKRPRRKFGRHRHKRAGGCRLVFLPGF